MGPHGEYSPETPTSRPFGRSKRTNRDDEKDRPVRSRARDHQVRPVGWGALTVRVSRGADRYSSPFSRPRSRREPNWSLFAPLLYAPLLPLRESSLKTLMP